MAPSGAIFVSESSLIMVAYTAMSDVHRSRIMPNYL